MVAIALAMLIVVCLLSAVMALEMEQDAFLISTDQSNNLPIKLHCKDAPSMIESLLGHS